MRASIALVTTLALAGCATAPAQPGQAVSGWEGFFELERLAPSTLADAEIPVARAVLDRLRPRVIRLILSGGEMEAPVAELDARLAQYCADPADRAWNEARCAGYEARECEAGVCRYPHFGSCSGFLVGGDFAITAAHCVAGLAKARLEASQVLLQSPEGRPVARTFEVLTLGKVDFEHHWVTDFPHAKDVAVLRVPGEDRAPVEAAPLPSRGAVVFVFGYPRVEGRAPATYRKVPGRLAASFGRIDERNEGNLPFCSVDGRQEGWRHHAPCPRIAPPDDDTMWRGPIAHHTFSTTMDTINGYSGAPVFDAEGRWIGVNSTIAGGVNPQEGYAPALRAIVTRASAAEAIVSDLRAARTRR